jgi:hypothetical protein
MKEEGSRPWKNLKSFVRAKENFNLRLARKSEGKFA